nr:hypothetical protein Iba_chr12bCG2150 [Ipomoea batatas]
MSSLSSLSSLFTSYITLVCSSLYLIVILNSRGHVVGFGDWEKRQMFDWLSYRAGKDVLLCWLLTSAVLVRPGNLLQIGDFGADIVRCGYGYRGEWAGLMYVCVT